MISQVQNRNQRSDPKRPKQKFVVMTQLIQQYWWNPSQERIIRPVSDQRKEALIWVFAIRKTYLRLRKTFAVNFLV